MSDTTKKDVDPALAAFASFIRSEEEQERAGRKAAKQARAAEQEAVNLVKAKDDAAANLKQLQSRSGVSPEERAAAEEAYRRALAAVVAAETGEAPAWAPPAPEPEPEAEPETDAGAEPEPAAEPDEAAADQDSDPAPEEPTADADPAGETEA